MKQDFDLFTSFFHRAAFSYEPIDETKVNFDELDRMAQNANKMLEDRMQAEEALKASEEKYGTVFSEARDGIILVDSDSGRIDDCNPSFEEMAGRPLSELRKMKIRELLPAVTEEKTKKTFQHIAEKGVGGAIYLEFRKPDGTSVPIEFVSKKMVCQNKPYILSIVRDISERKKTEEALRQVEKLESIGTLAGGIAHDFNNILMGLFGNISIAREYLPDHHPSRKTLDEAEKAMNRAVRLTGQLLTFARGGKPIRKTIDIRFLVEELVRTDLSGSGVESVFHIQEDIWKIEADSTQIRNALSAIVKNAIQTMPDGGILSVITENREIGEHSTLAIPPGKYVCISITDKGSGMDEKLINRIFEPYFTTRHTGSGMGLATAHSIVRRHGGYIDVDSRPGKGSTFRIYLPAGEADKLKIHDRTGEGQPEKDHGVRILVMDDEEMIRDVVSALLEKSGFSAITAENGEQAIEMYQKSIEAGAPYDAVIMDLTIPGGIGGREAVKDILSMDPDARVIVSSGYADDPVMANYADYGFCGIAAKPYSRNSLVEVLRQVLEKPRG